MSHHRLRLLPPFWCHKIYFVLMPLLLCGVSCQNAESPDDWQDYIHVPSPEWEDQIIYFIVTDRFMDGDSSNNDQGDGEYRKGDGGFWNGGDLQGIRQKIDYIKTLGATAIWITPPVANQWVNPQKSGTGNHGYWAENFKEVDKHLGNLEDYQKLSASLHREGMYLVQDVVCNHLGDFYTYTDDFDSTDVTKNFKRYDGNQPTQYPFNHNNALDSIDLEMGIYHFAPNFYDHSDTIKKRIYQYADLDDLNTANPLVRRTLRKSFNFWIDQVGVDGFRFDTPHFVEHAFWHDFIHSDEPGALGVEKFAKSTGKNNFFTFGETALFPEPLSDVRTKRGGQVFGDQGKAPDELDLEFSIDYIYWSSFSREEGNASADP